uniref:Secreted protein n=1 Tax=Globodera pallida TaxID=36090 RepID=A0A183BYK1_GLOPA
MVWHGTELPRSSAMPTSFCITLQHAGNCCCFCCCCGRIKPCQLEPGRSELAPPAANEVIPPGDHCARAARSTDDGRAAVDAQQLREGLGSSENCRN